MVSHITEVADGVHRLTNGVANFYLIQESGKLVLVDAGAPKDWAVFTRAALGLGKAVGDLDAVLLTHAYTDHTRFAERARAATGARVWIHERDLQAACTRKIRPRDGKAGAYLLCGAFLRTVLVLGMRGAAKVIPIQEVTGFSDGEVLDVPGAPRVVHAPGHAGGGAAILPEHRGVLFTGDVLCTHIRVHRAGRAADHAVRAERRHAAAARLDRQPGRDQGRRAAPQSWRTTGRRRQGGDPASPGRRALMTWGYVALAGARARSLPRAQSALPGRARSAAPAGRWLELA